MRKLISLITLLSFSVQAATITDDKLTVGKKASASAKEIVFDTNDGANNKKLSVDKVTKKLSATSDEVIIGDGTASDKALTFNRGGSNAQVKWNELTDKIQFSNDGTTFKDLGTGGGGGGSTGVNVLTNDSFEDAVGGVLTDWSNTGGTLTQQTYTNSVEGDAKYFQFVATGAGQYFEMVKTVPTNFNGQGCQVDFKKMNIATADLFKVEALDASNNVLATGNVKVSSWQKFPTLSFACPSAGSTFKIRVTSLAAGTLQGDKAYLGSNQNIVNTISTKDYERRPYSPTLTSFGAGATSDCYESRNGNYLEVECRILTGASLAATEARVSFPPGLTTPATMSTLTAVGVGHNPLYGTAGYVNTMPVIAEPSVSYFTFQAPSQTLFSKAIGTNFGPTTNFYFKARVPILGWTPVLQSEVAISPEQSSWFIDANIGGGNPSISGSVASYSELTNASLDMVINTTKGSATAEIPCASGTASSGLTCPTANESTGISFLPGAGAGVYEVCASFTVNVTNSQGTYFQLAETPNNSSTILQEGGQRTGTGFSVSTGSKDSSVFTCGLFNFSDVSKKTVRLMAETTGSGTTLVLGDRNSTTGQRDIRFTVRPFLSAYNRPILTGDDVFASYSSTYKDVTASRSAGVTYTNTTKNPIKVMVGYVSSNSSANSFFTVGGVSLPVQAAGHGGSYPYWLEAVVPRGATYSLTLGSGSLTKWVELRE